MEHPRTDKNIDSMGRATFHHITPRSDVRPTARENRWLKHIERHGPQSSTHLYELTKGTHSCKDTASRQLQKLRAGGFLVLPRQQRFTEHADFNPYIYDLTKQAQDRLIDLGIKEPTVRPTGHWWHGYDVARVTSVIEICAARDDVRYIPAHDILAIKDTPLAISVGGQKLIPDQLFALDYGGSYRAFALEVDRGTEPKTSPAARKSYASSIEMYRQMIEQDLHRSHYGLKATTLILWIFKRRSDEMKFLKLVDQLGGKAKGLICTRVMLERRAADTDICSHYQGEWSRSQQAPILLSRKGL